MTINRRGALALFGLGAGAAGAAAAKGRYAGKVAFRHGVASGDPLQNRVILWTRITPAAATDQPVAYSWALVPVDRRPGGARGSGVTDAGRDFTAKVDVGGLDPGRAYTFSFKANGVESPVGRTRTLPAGKVKDVVLAAATCALWPGGYFNAYEAIAKLPRVDAVLHLGDYIYEYDLGHYGKETGEKLGRIPDPPHEIVTLDDYRRRHAQAKSDPQLQAAHARAPWIVVWDDHETANDSWEGGAEDHQPATEGDWNVRKAVAIKAYYEWMPIREPAGESLFASYRSFHFGDLASLIMTETRLTARSQQLTYKDDLPIVDGKPDIAAFQAKWMDPARRMMSPAQEAWIGRELAASVKAGHAWQVLGNQVVMARVAGPDFETQLGADKWKAVLAGLPEDYRAPVGRLARLGKAGLPYNLDSWDGYPADRRRLYDAFQASGANPIVLSGDSHAFWANELFGEGEHRLAAEFGVTGITSPGAGDIIKDVPLDQGFADTNKEVIFTDQAAKGFLLLTLTRDSAKGELMAVSTILEKDYSVKVLKTYTVAPIKGGGVEALKEI